MSSQNSSQSRFNPLFYYPKEIIQWMLFGWRSHLFWGAIFGSIMTLIMYWIGIVPFVKVGILFGVGFFAFTFLIYNGKGF